MGIEEHLGYNVLTTSLEKLVDWGTKNSLWPATFGLACCAIEMIVTAANRFDIARFGMEAFRATPRQADLMIVAGTVCKKMMPPIQRIYDQMTEPKWVIAMGACASSGVSSTPTRWSRGSTCTSPWTSTSPAARPGPKACCTGYSSSMKRFSRIPS